MDGSDSSEDGLDKRLELHVLFVFVNSSPVVEGDTMHKSNVRRRLGL